MWSRRGPVCWCLRSKRGCVAAWYTSVVGCVVQRKSAHEEATFVSGFNDHLGSIRTINDKLLQI